MTPCRSRSILVIEFTGKGRQYQLGYLFFFRETKWWCSISVLAPRFSVSASAQGSLQLPAEMPQMFFPIMILAITSFGTQCRSAIADGARHYDFYSFHRAILDSCPSIVLSMHSDFCANKIRHLIRSFLSPVRC